MLGSAGADGTQAGSTSISRFAGPVGEAYFFSPSAS
jgi:hypothetical protein